MSQKMKNLSPVSGPKLKAMRKRRLLAFLVVSIVIQLGLFYGGEKLLAGNSSGTDVEPSVKTEVRQRKVSLVPSPYSPGNMAVSADHSMLALTDTDQLRIYNLTDGREIQNISLQGQSVGALRWLPDRDRLIYALMNNETTSRVVKERVQQYYTGVKDETYSTDTYRPSYDYRTVTEKTFKIDLYSVDGQEGAQPELIKTLRQPGRMPEKLNLSLSTYTNLLYVYWTSHEKNYLVQVDIMKRIKDIRLPRGELTRLVVSQRSGTVFTEFIQDGSAIIYRYNKGRWKQQTYLDGYRLLGITPDDQLAVAPDENGQAKEVSLVDDKENLKPGWNFSSPIRVNKVNILNDGRLVYFDHNRVIVLTPQIGKGTVFDLPKVDGYSPDMKTLVSWQPDSNQLNIMEEVEETVKK